MCISASYNQAVVSPVQGVHLCVKREDLLHPQVSGNKFRKLKYNLEMAKLDGAHTLLTFGGAFSNHVLAVAAAGKHYGFKTIGIIRGEELMGKISNNPTLRKAAELGMQLEFVSREIYRLKDSSAMVQQLQDQFGDFYLLPEGGTNSLAIRGCQEILTEEDQVFDVICSAVGTGGTLAGLINSTTYQQRVLGFPVLKAWQLKSEISKFANNNRWTLITDYHFGGYAKINEELIRFMNEFFRQTGILLDPVYTGKMMFGLFDLIRQGYFPTGAKILAIHTGGLQGIQGMNQKLANKQLPLIDTDD